MKYHIIVFGCQMNISDAQNLAGVLETAGYEFTENQDKADLLAIVACSVRQSAVDRVYGLANKYKNIKNKPTIILTGCVLKKDKKKLGEVFDFVIDIKDINKFPEIARQQVLKDPRRRAGMVAAERRGAPRTEQARAGERRVSEKTLLPSESKAYLSISNGCNNFCTYCVVPYTRGRLVCKDHNKIIKDAKKLAKQGFKEIWLLGQNVNDYQSPTDKFVNFAKLLELVNNVEGDFKIFFMSPNPKNFSDELISVMAKSKKYSRYLNLPIQSGDNEILKRMNRPYSKEKYLELIKKIRAKMPDINLSTDVIVGFPGETKKQFKNTENLFKKVKFNIAYINKYSPRFGTAAAKLKDDVEWPEKKRREKILQDIINEKYRYVKK